MAEKPLVERELVCLKTLEQLSLERAKGETETEEIFKGRRFEEDKTYQASKTRIATVARTDTQNVKAKYQAARDAANTSADRDTAALQAEYDQTRKTVTAKAQSQTKAAKKALEETRWQALAVFESGKDGAIRQYKTQEAQISAASHEIEDLKAAAAPTLARLKRFAPATTTAAPAESGSEAPAITPESAPDDPIEALQAKIPIADEKLTPLEKLFLPKFLAPSTFIWPFLLLGLGLAYPLATSIDVKIGAGIAAGVAIALAIGVWIALAKVARRQLAPLYTAFTREIEEAEALAATSVTWSKADFEKRKADTETLREQTIKKAEDKLADTLVDIEERKDKGLKEADASFPPRLKAVADRREAALKDADAKYPPLLEQIQVRYKAEMQKLEESYAQIKETTERLYQEAWNKVEFSWRDGLAEVDAITKGIDAQCQEHFLDWHNTEIKAWQPPKTVPDGLQFARYTIELSDIDHGIPTDPRLIPYGPTKFEYPALVPFPDHGSVLIKTMESGKAEAVKVLQTLMLRYITSIPPGKVRFTIIDPVGLGENFSAFMHLGDYSELLINSRIWTETPHIEQRLADLSAHMENVIQKYLRNEFDSIEAYNVFAGEVAEPFRILVVANFPANFNESSTRRLLSIAASGARCGVYTLISLDSKLQLPTGVQLKDLEAVCMILNWRDGKLNWRQPDFGRFPLVFDTPPASEVYTTLMHKVGDLAKNANKVEVPFEFIAPKVEDYWTADSSGGVDVPLGRAGATKLQSLKLGKGTSQHVLTAGKTGSGKSTLLHALITNAALRYSPDQLELYLIDFKKGVEFKVYASMELPHARVIAVESEREFGLSVLQRLDVELKERGDTFRDLGVQDLRGYREATGNNPPLPRVLFVVDEFQEFFVEDDKVAQEVALLLDRMVRQGRAFGIHVILGSQTLSGSFSLPRSTLGQMAVRIALQCSEADAHMILSEENSAARLLTRPGEAIYNDQNGMIEGNNFFQVVLLSDASREGYLRQLRELSIARNKRPRSQIIFEGNLPAIPSKNYLLNERLASETWPTDPLADQAWLGEAIAIKDPTAAVFRPQSGSNVLIVGQNDEMAVAIAMMAIVGLSAQHSPAGVSFYLFDGSPPDAPFVGQIAKVGDVIPQRFKNVNQRELASVLGEVNAEVERRQAGTAGDNPPVIYLFVHDIQRYRDLRKADDDFGSFGRFGEEKVTPPSKLFTNILKDGPPLGIHTIVWCDSMNNLNRTFDRQSLREFEMRILFQMSSNDSSSLIDAPTASKLGPNRALFFSEEEGRLEKFRPYSIPEQDWLQNDVKARFDKRPKPEPFVEPVVAKRVEKAPEPAPLFESTPVDDGGNDKTADPLADFDPAAYLKEAAERVAKTAESQGNGDDVDKDNAQKGDPLADFDPAAYLQEAAARVAKATETQGSGDSVNKDNDQNGDPLADFDPAAYLREAAARVANSAPTPAPAGEGGESQE